MKATFRQNYITRF